MTIFSDALRNLMELPGAQYLCCAERGTGAIIAERGIRVVDPEEVVAWVAGVGLLLARAPDADELDDLMVTSGRHYHVLRQIAAEGWPPIVVYLCLDRARSNLARARRELAVLDLARPGSPALGSGAVPGGTAERRSASVQLGGSLPPSPPVGSVPRPRPDPSPRPEATARPRPSPTPRKSARGDGGSGDGGSGDGGSGSGGTGDGRAAGSDRAHPAAGRLPRRVPGTPLPPPRPAALADDRPSVRDRGPDAGGRAWSHDVGTMRRLLVALRCLK